MQILIFITGVFVILWIVSWFFEDFKNETSTNHPENSDKKNYDRLLKNGGRISGNKKVWRSRVPYSRLIREMVYFTRPILAEKKIKTFPDIKICYYEHKKNMGVFTGYKDEVRIYVKGHESIESLADTVLHEMAHYIQKTSDKKEFKLYDQYLEQYGYYDNPLEVGSRKFAKDWVKPCINYLSNRALIVYR
jgi:hypothetical protein